MNQQNLYPYLVTGQPLQGWESLHVPVGHGISAVLFEDHESGTGIGHTAIGPDDLRAAGLSPVEAHRVALDNLLRFADEDDRLSIQVLGKPGDPVHFLLYTDHPRAAACLRLPDLHEHAAELLGSADLCACVPQRESLVIFPKRDRVYRDTIVAKLREIEADAEHPLGFALFDLTPTGVVPLAE